MSATVETVDAVVVDDDRAPEQSTALVRRERRSEVIRPLDPDQLVESFHAYQDLLPRLLTESDYQGAGDDRFVKKSGWRKIAAAFDLDVQIIHEEVERDDTGHILRAKTTARATAPSGRAMDGDGYCTIDEFTGRRATNPKLENDLRGTAATRAKNRAISDLVGMGAVSAEEVAAGGQAGAPAEVKMCSPQQLGQLRNGLAFLLSGDADDERVADVLARIEKDHGSPGIPWVASRAVLHVAASLKALRDGKDIGL